MITVTVGSSVTIQFNKIPVSFEYGHSLYKGHLRHRRQYKKWSLIYLRKETVTQWQSQLWHNKLWEVPEVFWPGQLLAPVHCPTPQTAAPVEVPPVLQKWVNLKKATNLKYWAETVRSRMQPLSCQYHHLDLMIKIWLGSIQKALSSCWRCFFSLTFQQCWSIV